MSLQLDIKKSYIDDSITKIEADVTSIEDIYYIVSNNILKDFKSYFQQKFMKSIYLNEDERFVVVNNSTIDFNKIPQLIYNNLQLSRTRDGWTINVKNIMYRGLSLSDILLNSEYGNSSSKPRPIFRIVIQYFYDHMTNYIIKYLLELRNTSLLSIGGKM